MEDLVDTEMKSIGKSSGQSSDGSFRPLSLNADQEHPALFQYVAKKRWKKLRKFLKRRKGDYIEKCKERDSTGLSLFGYAVASGAPNDVLDAIIKVEPSQFYSPDHFGATPLHIACLNGAPLRTVKYLIKISQGELVRARDSDARVPLHHSVECVARGEMPYGDAIECIQRLYDADTSLIHASDNYSDSPIDIAQIAISRTKSKEMYNTVYKLYQFLTSLSIKEYKRKKNIWENEGYDTGFHMSKESVGTISTATASDMSGAYSTATCILQMENSSRMCMYQSMGCSVDHPMGSALSRMEE